MTAWLDADGDPYPCSCGRGLTQQPGLCRDCEGIQRPWGTCNECGLAWTVIDMGKGVGSVIVQHDPEQAS